MDRYKLFCKRVINRIVEKSKARRGYGETGFSFTGTIDMPETISRLKL